MEPLRPELSSHSIQIVSFLKGHGFEFIPEKTEDCLQLVFRYDPNPWHRVVGIDLLESGRPLVVGQAVNPGWGNMIAPEATLAGLAGNASEEFKEQFLGWRKGVTLREAKASSPKSRLPNIAKSTGTGFFVSPEGDALTAFHVVDGASRIVIKTASGSEFFAKVHKIDPQNDLAVLRVEAATPHFLEFGISRSVGLGDSVFTLGYPAPDLLGGEVKFTGGEISALSGFQGSQSMMQITVPIQPGNSGGPLFQADGKVIGIVTSTAALQSFLRSTGTLPQNVSWAVKSDYARLLIDQPAAGSSLDPRVKSELAKAVFLISAE
jgi:S1-C subfamily serine protease